MQTFNFTLTGAMPLLMHASDFIASDIVTDWRKDPANKHTAKGDDREPAWTWQTYLYHNDKEVVMPADNIMAALRAAGTQIILNGKKTFKELTQVGLIISGEYCTFTSNDKPVSMEFIRRIHDLPFIDQARACKEEGFQLFGKRCKPSSSSNARHIRIRPRFDHWKVSGQIIVAAAEFTQPKLNELFTIAGRMGLGDWRPNCKTPGPYGQFTSVITPAK